MGRRKKRIDKKFHARWIEEVLLSSIGIPEWGEDFLGLKEGEILEVDSGFVEGRDDEVAYLIRRFRLHYELGLATPEERDQDPYPSDGALVFRLRSARHPEVCVFIEEFEDEIGKS